MSSEERQLLSSYASISIESLAKSGLNHNLLIYQNVLDRTFLQHQLLPFLNVVGSSPKVYLNFSNDGPGHVAIPSNNLDEILKSLVDIEQISDAIEKAGFLHPPLAGLDIVKMLPEVTKEISSVRRKYKQAIQELERAQIEYRELADANMALKQKNAELDAVLKQVIVDYRKQTSN